MLIWRVAFAQAIPVFPLFARAKTTTNEKQGLNLRQREDHVNKPLSRS